jgi:protein SCO1/2
VNRSSESREAVPALPIVQRMRRRCAAPILGLLTTITAGSAFAALSIGPTARESTIDPSLMQIDEARYLGTVLQPDYALVDADGRQFTLGDMMGKPLIIVLSYYSCDGSCPILNANLKQTLSRIDRFELGADYGVLTVSFDKEDTVQSARRFVEKVGIPRSMREGWRHAVLQRAQTDVDRLTANVGFKYFWSRADQVFLHSNALIFVTPEGRVARYLYGTSIDKKEVELALIDADWNRIAKSTNVIDILTGICYSYNFKEGRYTLNYPLFIGGASLLGGISLVVLSAVIFRKRKLRRLSHV